MFYHCIVGYCTHGIVKPIWDKLASYTISTNVCICLRKTFAHQPTDVGEVFEVFLFYLHLTLLRSIVKDL